MNIEHGLKMLAEQGLNMFAALELDGLPHAFNQAARTSGIRIEDYSRLLLFGHGGNRMWKALNKHGMTGTDPVDHHSVFHVVRFVQRYLDACPYRILYPGNIPIPLQQLGSLAGWHHCSPLGIGVNGTYGPWFGYRAVVLVRAGLPFMTEPPAPSPCEQCADKPCISVCPASALSAGAPPDVGACIDYRMQTDSTCALKCLARLICPIGTRFRYCDEQVRYFYGRSLESIKAFQAE